MKHASTPHKKNVKDQNWFAVVIDFAIVVFGILLAFHLATFKTFNPQISSNF